MDHTECNVLFTQYFTKFDSFAKMICMPKKSEDAITEFKHSEILYFLHFFFVRNSELSLYIYKTFSQYGLMQISEKRSVSECSIFIISDKIGQILFQMTTLRELRITSLTVRDGHRIKFGYTSMRFRFRI